MAERKILSASDGMILTDGKTFGTIIFLADGESVDKYREITKSEYENILSAEEDILPGE